VNCTGVMAAALYSLKIKNTFIEVDADDDTSSNFSFDDDEGLRRQVTEPAPSTTPLFGSMARPKYLSECIHTADHEEVLEGSTASSDEQDLKALKHSESAGSTASSDDHTKATEPFQPECEPDFGPFPGQMARQVTEELCWNTWSEKPWQFDTEYACISPCFGQAIPQQYSFEPFVDSSAVGAFLVGEEIEGNVFEQPRTTCKKHDDANRKANNGRRRKRESLIDMAARKQKQQSKKEKQASQQQRRQAPSTHASAGNQRLSSKPQPAKYCHSCGASCHPEYKFCRFCGAAVP